MARKPIVEATAQEDKYASEYFAGVYPWHGDILTQFQARYPNLPHGLLLGGMAGTGKRRFANVFTAWLLCHDKTSHGACGACASCGWLKMGNHPNLVRVERTIDDKGKQSKQIKIDQIRDLTSFVQQTSQGFRVIIIDPAESLNTAAANALLKTLEEPAAHVILLLISDQPLQLPATIRSRLQQLPLSRINEDQAVNYIAEKSNTPSNQATQLWRLSGGAPLLALQLTASPVYQARQAWIQDWQKLIQGRVTPLALSAIWQKKLDLAQWLTLLQQMLRDVLASHVGQAPLQQDLDFLFIKQNTTPQKLMQIEQLIYQTINAQNQNVQPSLVFDWLMGVLSV